MTRAYTTLRTCGITICVFILCLQKFAYALSDVSLNDIAVVNKTCDYNGYYCDYFVKVYGNGVLAHRSWRLTGNGALKNELCTDFLPSYEIRDISTCHACVLMKISIPRYVEKFYLCLYDQENVNIRGKWLHQGPQSEISNGNNVNANIYVQNTERLAKEDYQSVERLGLQRSLNLEDFKPDVETTEKPIDLTHDIDVNYVRGIPKDNRAEVFREYRSIAKRSVPDIDDTAEYDSTSTGNLDTGAQDSRHIGISANNDVETNIGIGKRSAIDKTVESDITSTGSLDIGAEGGGHIVIGANNDVETNIAKAKRSAPDDYIHKIAEFDSKNTGSLDIAPADGEHIVTGANNDVEINILDIVSAMVPQNEFKHETKLRKKRLMTFDMEEVKMMGLRIETADKLEMGEAIPSLLAQTEATLRLFGEGFTDSTVIVFTNEELPYGEKCIFPLPGQFKVTPDPYIKDTATVRIIAPEPKQNSTFYMCARRDADSTYIHQGTETWKSLMTHNRVIPLWATILLISVCLMFSALFSGLNLGLMSLDRTELKIISNTGSDLERKYARAIAPVRDHGNFLLCSILLGNVAVNSTFTILLDGLTSGLFAVIFSTLAIVIMGEIIPQAICSRHGLAIGANTIVLMKVVMGITSPLAYPVSRLLDCVLGEEIGNVYNRERLKELVKVTNDVNDLDKDEVNIISGALELRKKTVTEVMTKIEDAFMLSLDSVLDFETMSEIVKSGFSRIPVFEEKRNNIVTVLFIKDLAFVDPDDNTPLRTLCQFYQNPCNFVFEDVTLDIMFKQFKEGNKGHMAFVHRVNNEGEGDPFYEVIGLVTLEDVIEELIQAEIVDETDVFTDNRSKRLRKTNKLKDFAAFAEKREHQRFRISPQLTLAAFQYLSTLDAFRTEFVSERVLRRLLRQDIITQIRVKAKDKSDPSTFIYSQGKSADYFVLILEGRAEVTVGREGLVFEAGPFTYFGVQVLSQNVGGIESPTIAPSTIGSLQNINMESAIRYSFIPDYSVRAVCDIIYLTIKRSLYLAAKRATLMEKTSSLSRGSVIGTGEMFDKEVDKLLASLDEDISVGGGDIKTPSRQRSSISSLQPASPAKHHQNTTDANALSEAREHATANREHATANRELATATRDLASSNRELAMANRELVSTTREPEQGEESEPDEQSKLIQWIS